MYELSTTDVSLWEENVKKTAIEIIESYITNTICAHKPLKSNPVVLTPLAEDHSYYCEICERIFIGSFQWEAHMKSKKHQKVVRRKNLGQKEKVKESVVESTETNNDVKTN